jgi:hypothetical protein
MRKNDVGCFHLKERLRLPAVVAALALTIGCPKQAPETPHNAGQGVAGGVDRTSIIPIFTSKSIQPGGGVSSISIMGNVSLL